MNHLNIRMKSALTVTVTAVLCLFPLIASSQEEESSVTKEIELGALSTSGNTEKQVINFAGAIVWDRDEWEYGTSLDGLYSTSDSEVKGQRVYIVGYGNYEFSTDSFLLTRIAHEDDRFSGFDSQSDITFSYGRDLLRNQSNMGLTLNAGIGVRWSRVEGSDFDEPIIRLAGDYDWAISDTASFKFRLSSEAGSDTDIYRSETSIDTQILDNLSLRFSFNVKHQTTVPVGKEQTDTETAVTFVMNF